MPKANSHVLRVQVSTRSAATTGAGEGQSAMQTAGNTVSTDHSPMTGGKVANQSDVPYLLIYNGILAAGW